MAISAASETLTAYSTELKSRTVLSAAFAKYIHARTIEISYSIKQTLVYPEGAGVKTGSSLIFD